MEILSGSGTGSREHGDKRIKSPFHLQAKKSDGRKHNQKDQGYHDHVFGSGRTFLITEHPPGNIHTVHHSPPTLKT
jgi:hypothetical protein